MCLSCCYHRLSPSPLTAVQVLAARKSKLLGKKAAKKTKLKEAEALRLLQDERMKLDFQIAALGSGRKQQA